MAKTVDATPPLCYEVWTESESGDRQMVGAYWDVVVAWIEAERVASEAPELDVDLIVANGRKHDVRSGVVSRRTDVK